MVAYQNLVTVYTWCTRNYHQQLLVNQVTQHYYTIPKNADGQGYWGIDNDVSGWTLSEKGERLPLGWGNDRTYVSGYNVPYIVLKLKKQ